MINTIFYFPDSLTFDQYLNKLDQNSDDGIASRTIVLAKQQGKIYNNGKLYGTTSSDVQALINAAKSELEAQDAALNQSIEEAISQFSNNINSLQNEIESDIQNAINTAKSYDDLIKTDLNTANNQITAVSTKVNQIEDRIDGFSEGGNIKYTQALQSVINSGINNNAAFNNISSRWAVADENQNLLQWMASGFQSQSEQGSSFAQIYSTDKSTINNNIQSAAAAVKTAVSTNENGIVSSAMGQILSSLTNNEINNVSGLITKVDEKASQSDVISAISIANTADSKADSANSAASSLSAALTTLDGSVVKKASVITSINNTTEESTVKINADKIKIGDITITGSQISDISQIIANNVTASYINNTLSYDDSNLTRNVVITEGKFKNTLREKNSGGTYHNSEWYTELDGDSIELFYDNKETSYMNTGRCVIGPGYIRWTHSNINGDSLPITLRYSPNRDALSILEVDSGIVKAAGFRIEGGTSTQFLKADGSIDTTSYLPSSVINYFLPLAGGTLTGNITAPQFIKADSSDDYVLLAGGGTKALSEFQFVSSQSDETLKNKIADVELTAEQIAEAPAIKYTWKDKEKDQNIHVGTIAQYWQEVLPETVSTDSNEKLMLDYQGAAMAAVINLAKEVVELKAKIAELESKLTL